MFQQELLQKAAQQQGRIHTAQEIVPFLFLGSLATATDAQFLSSRNVRRVLSVGSHLFPSLPVGVTHLNVDILDEDREAFGSDRLAQCVAFIREGLPPPHQGLPRREETKEDGKEVEEGPPSSVLVHCEGGISRSPTVVAAFLVAEWGLSAEAALELVRQKRPCVCPNRAFRRQLADWADRCARAETAHSSCGEALGRV
eukprot:TRINITY_DN23375_c0_g1_i1.p2 TRINITY_DN23375_c0_g1~~TRINITY_DN23375_c0_g1_i1.p2  ORF type:complete len:199 (+),score=42.05 TRINITY_DN23375_c0_g1_i1:324-920(+)